MKTINRSTGAEIVNLNAFRRAHKAKLVNRSGLLHDVMPSKDEGFKFKLADSISLQEGYDIARSIERKFSAKGALFNAFVARRKRDISSADEDFHQILIREQKRVADYSIDELKALMALYAKNPSQYYETYIVPAAEEYLSRFQENVEEA